MLVIFGQLFKFGVVYKKKEVYIQHSIIQLLLSKMHAS